MLLRDFLNEFELDWAQAAVRSGQIPQRSLKGARILLAGEQMELQEAIAWSFMAWNDEKHSGVKVAEAAVQADGTLAVTHSFTTEPVTGVTADYVILTGLCCAQVPQIPLEQLEYLQTFGALADAVCHLNCKRILLLSDGRVYGALPPEFAASEYEAGKTDVAAYIKGEGSGKELQYFAYRTNVWRMPSTQRTHGVYDGKIYGRGKGAATDALGSPFLLCEHP